MTRWAIERRLPEDWLRLILEPGRTPFCNCPSCWSKSHGPIPSTHPIPHLSVTSPPNPSPPSQRNQMGFTSLGWIGPCSGKDSP